MTPAVRLPPAAPFTSQVTELLVVPVTVALNCCVCPTSRLVLVGEMVRETPLGEGGGTTLTWALADNPTTLVK